MAVTDVDTRALIEAHRAGHVAAFEEIVRRHHDRLHAHAYRRLGDHHAAEDAVQETFIRAYRALPRFNGEYRLGAWLYRICTNVCSDEGARRVRETTLRDRCRAEPVTPESSPTDSAEAVMAVRQALDSLPDPYREALMLRYADDLPFSEVAQAAGVSEENARARAHRGRTALRRILGSAGGVLVAVLVPWRRAQRLAVDKFVQLDAAAATTAAQSTPVAEVGTATATKAMLVAGIIASMAAPAAVDRALPPAPEQAPTVIVADHEEPGATTPATLVSLTTPTWSDDALTPSGALLMPPASLGDGPAEGTAAGDGGASAPSEVEATFSAQPVEELSDPQLIDEESTDEPAPDQATPAPARALLTLSDVVIEDRCDTLRLTALGELRIGEDTRSGELSGNLHLERTDEGWERHGRFEAVFVDDEWGDALYLAGTVSRMQKSTGSARYWLSGHIEPDQDSPTPVTARFGSTEATSDEDEAAPDGSSPSGSGSTGGGGCESTEPEGD